MRSKLAPSRPSSSVRVRPTRVSSWPAAIAAVASTMRAIGRRTRRPTTAPTTTRSAVAIANAIAVRVITSRSRAAIVLAAMSTPTIATVRPARSRTGA